MPILFSSIFHFVKGLSDYVKSITTLPPEEKDGTFHRLFQEGDIVNSIDSLLKSIPIAHENIKCSQKSHKRILLIELTEKVEHLRSIFPNIQFSTSLSRKELEETEVWTFECENSDRHPAKSWSFSYIDLIINEIGKVRFIPEMQLQICKLSVDEGKVYINLEWHGAFENIEYLDIPGEKRQYWTAICRNMDSPLSFTIMMYFLYLQIAVAWGENEFILGELLPDNKLTASIQISIAGPKASNAQLPLSETAWQNVSNYFVWQSYPYYSEASQQLEQKLGEELEHRKKYVENGLLENKYVDQIQTWIDNLAQYRKDYLQEINNLK